MDKEIKDRIDAIRQSLSTEHYYKTGIGMLPCDWRVAKLSGIAEKVTQTAGTDSYETVSISAGIGFVNQAEKFGKELSGKQYEKYTVLHKGDFSYNKGNSNKYPQGCIYRLKDRETAAVPNVFESFKIQAECAEFYDHLFVSGFLNQQLSKKINHGVRDDGLLNLTEKDFYSCLLPVPPLAEQKKIAEILDHYDKLIKLCEAKVNEYKSLKKTCLSKMFPQNGSSVPELRFPGFTEAWEQCKLGEIGTTYTGLSGKSKSDFGHGKGKFITYMNVFSNPITSPEGVEPIEIDNRQNEVQAGDVFFTTSSETPEEVGMSSVLLENKGKTYLNSFCFGYRPTEKIDNHYLAYMLRSDNVRKKIIFLAQGISRYNISKNKMMDIDIPIPSYGEQEQIGLYFTHLDNLITLHQRKVEEYTKLKKAMTQLLLTGIVRV